MERYKVLVVEDDAELAAQLGATLGSLGFQVTDIVSSKTKPFEQAGKSKPDIVLINLALSDGIDSIELASKIQKALNIPVVFMASDVDGLWLQRAREIRPYGYVFRPSDPKELYAVIHLAFDQREQEAKTREATQWLYTVMDSVGDAVIVSDEEDRIRFMNSTAETYTGWQRKNTLGKPLKQVFDVFNSTPKNAGGANDEAVLATGGSTSQTGHFLTTKTGEKINIVDWAIPIISAVQDTYWTITVFRYISTPIEMPELVKSILQWAIELLGAQAGEIFLYNPERNELVCAITLGFMQEFTGVAVKPGEGLTGKVFETREPLIVEDYLSWPGRSKAFESAPMFNTVLHVPLLWGGKCIGTLGIDSDSRTHQFSEEDVRLVSLFANLAAITIENVRLFGELKTRLEEQKFILETQVTQRTKELTHLARQLETNSRVSREITSILEINNLLNRLVSLIREGFNCYYTQIFLIDEETGHLVLRAASGGAGMAQERKMKSLEIGPGSLNGLAADTGQMVIVNDISREPNFLFDELTPLTQSELVVPLRIGNKILGTLDLQDSQNGTFKEEDKLVFESLGDQVAIAIENARLYEQSGHIAVLEERNRMARELHDSVTQSLFSLDLHARAIVKYMETDPQKARVQIDSLRQITHDTLEEMRSLILDLHPPSISEIGLVPALRQQINRLKRSAGPEIRISTAGEHRLSAELEEGLFRIAQESLRNAVKHSGGSKISLDLVMSQNAVVLTVSDNGRGFDPSRPLDRRAFGLIGMRERAELLGANLSIETLPGRGTKVTVNVPIDKRG